MADPVLQSSARPTAPRRRQLMLLGLVAIAVLGLGIWQGPSRHPPRLLTSDAAEGPTYLRTVSRLFTEARQRIWVMVYVLRPENEAAGVVDGLLDQLQAARRRGVDVRVLIDQGRRWDTGEIDPKHERAGKALAARDIPFVVDELDRTSHSKVVLVDDRWAVIGSHNWTRSALVRNRETSVLSDDPDLVRALEAHFQTVPAFR